MGWQLLWLPEAWTLTASSSLSTTIFLGRRRSTSTELVELAELVIPGELFPLSMLLRMRTSSRRLWLCVPQLSRRSPIGWLVSLSPPGMETMVEPLARMEEETTMMSGDCWSEFNHVLYFVKSPQHCRRISYRTDLNYVILYSLINV